MAEISVGMKIRKEIEIEIEEWEIKIEANTGAITLVSLIDRDLPPKIDLDAIPEFIELLQRVYAELTSGIDR